MSCAACQARVEKAVSKVEGVDSCSVSLLTNSMGVEGNASPEDVIHAVTAAGYGARLKADDTSKEAARGSYAADEAALEDKETPVLKKRLFTSIGFLLVLMYFSMGHMMWDWPLPGFFENNHVAMGIAQMILAAIVMVIIRSSLSTDSGASYTAPPTWTRWSRWEAPPHSAGAHMCSSR